MHYPIRKVTVISLVYNNTSLLKNAIESLNSQNFDNEVNVEYLIVDDFSTIIDLELIHSYIKGINNKNITPRLLLNKFNMGTVSSFNNAIKQSTGDIIIPLSADDSFYDDNVISDIINEFNKRNCLLLTGLRVPVLSSTEFSSLPEHRFHSYFSKPKKLMNHLLVKGNIISGSSTYYHRKIFDIIGLFNEEYRLLEDYPFYLKALEYGINIELFNRKVIKYGVSGVSSAGRLHPALEKDQKLLLGKILINDNLSFYQKRFVFYRRYLTPKNKYTIINTILFFELYLLEMLVKSLKR